MGDGIMTPPDGLSLRDQARWWLQEPVMLEIALENNSISREVFEEMQKVGIDKDSNLKLAHEIIDRCKVPGMKAEDRSRMYANLTDGGEWSPTGRGRKSNVARDLKVALETAGMQNARERNRKAREIAGDRKDKGAKYSADSNNITKLMNKAQSALEKLDGQDAMRARIIRMIVSSVEPLPTDQELNGMVELMLFTHDQDPAEFELWLQEMEGKNEPSK